MAKRDWLVTGRFAKETASLTADSTANANHGTLVDGGAGTVGPQWTGYVTTKTRR